MSTVKTGIRGWASTDLNAGVHQALIVLAFDTAHPLEARIRLEGKEWVFALDLLKDALATASGERVIQGHGNVLVGHVRDGIAFQLKETTAPPAGWTGMFAPAAKTLYACAPDSLVGDFLSQVDAARASAGPEDREVADELDRWLSDVLRGRP